MANKKVGLLLDDEQLKDEVIEGRRTFDLLVCMQTQLKIIALRLGDIEEELWLLRKAIDNEPLDKLFD